MPDLLFDIIDFEDGTKRLKITPPPELQYVTVEFQAWRDVVKAVEAEMVKAEAHDA